MMNNTAHIVTPMVNNTAPRLAAAKARRHRKTRLSLRRSAERNYRWAPDILL